MRNYQRYMAGILCGLMTFLWSGTAELLVSAAHASELQDEFNKQRQTIRNLELNATKAMIAAAPVCDVFENKLSQLMASVAPKISTIVATTPQPQLSPEAANAFSASEKNTSFANTWFQNDAKKLSDKTITQLDNKITAKATSAKDLGLDPAVANLIDNSPKLAALLDETFLSAQTCKPLYTQLSDAEATLNNALNQWIELANKINSNGALGPRLEANGMWVAVKIRRATRKDMHTTIPDLTNAVVCAGDVLTQQSIPNIFQGLANTDSALVMKSLSEIIQQSQCIDIQQSIALDRGLTMGAVASILAFNSAANIPLRKHLLETLIIAGAPILEANKVLGPTGLWILTQTLLLKEKSHPDIWVLDKESFLVSYGITVPSRETAKAVTLPICAEEPPAVATAKLDTSLTTNTQAPIDMKKSATEFGLFDVATLFNTKSEPPKIIVVDPEDAPLAYGYTVKELKAKICPVTPSLVSAAVVPTIGPLNKGLGGKCYKANEITDANRGDHLGYATCSLPDMILNGRVCKAKLCGASNLPQSGMLGITNPFGGEMPALGTGTECGFPAVQGILPECQLAGKNTTVFANLTNNSGCGNFKQLSLVANSAPEIIVLDTEYITGPKKAAEPAEEDKPEKPEKPDKPDKPEKATQPDIPKASTVDLPAKPVAGGPAAKLPPQVTPGKNEKFWYEVAKSMGLTETPVPQSGITTEKQYVQAVEKAEALALKLEVAEMKFYDSDTDAEAIKLFGPVKKLRNELKELEDAIFNSKFRFTYKPITDDKSLLENTKLLNELQATPCVNLVCKKKVSDLRSHIAGSDYFKKRMTQAASDAKKVMENPKIRAIMKGLRDKMLGKPIDDDAYNIAYDAMLSFVDISALPAFYNLDGVAGHAEKNSIVSIIVPSFESNDYPEEFYDDLVGLLIHEYIEHVLSHFLGLYGYNFEGKPDEGDKASHPDHQLGIQLQPLTGIAMGYTDPPLILVRDLLGTVVGSHYDYTGYKYYLPDNSSGSPNKTAGNSEGNGPSGSSQPGSNNSGATSGGGTPNKDCPPDSPNCGGMSACQLVTLAAAAKCDMATGKIPLKLIPGGGLTVPESKLDKATADWLSCLFPEPATGKDDDCQTKISCSQGETPSKDSKTGACSCKPIGAGGDVGKGYQGGADNCQLITCADNSTHHCCMSPGEASRSMPGQALPETQAPAKVPGRAPETDSLKQRDGVYQEYQERLPDQQSAPTPERGVEVPATR